MAEATFASMPSNAELMALNRAAWDVRASQHVVSEFYDVAGWLAGACSLKPPELALLGEVGGRRLLHLQCHFGQDTLSLARRGARVTGVDFSRVAIAQARSLAREASLRADFVEGDVLDADRHPRLRRLLGNCDVVFASYGTIGWLPDLARWATVVRAFLRPGGRLVFVEFHPLLELLGDDGLEVEYSYFGAAPSLETEGTYVDVAEERPMPTAYWDHPISEVVDATLGAGLTLDTMREYDYSPYDILGERGAETAPGRWQLRGSLAGKVPLTYALVATRPLLLACAALLLAACSPFSSRHVHDAAYVAAAAPEAPDYEDPAAWAALPYRDDAADAVPPGLLDLQSQAAADVFFVHPTLYTRQPDGRFPWNASLDDTSLNGRVDESTIRMQASVFNGAGRVFAPRYRQAHISAYYTPDSAKARAAFDTAYADVRAAFDYFLRANNEGRPIVLAGHSQGTTHAKRLAREYFDVSAGDLGHPHYAVSRRLVAAYLVGMPISPVAFEHLQPCTDSTATGCYVTWRTWQRPAMPDDTPAAVVVNPLTWTTDTAYAPARLNRGGTLRKLKLVDQLTDAQVHEGVLWINRPDFFGSRIIRMDNWHPADYNLFYANVRDNARARVAAFTSDR